MNTKIVLSVIVPNIGSLQCLHDVLTSIDRQICTVPFEVIVVADLPESQLRRAVESYGPKYRYFESGRLGANIARNKGLEKARGSIVLFIDDDCYIQDRGYLERHARLHREYSDAAGIGGRYSLYPGATNMEAAYHWSLDHHLTASISSGKDSTLLLGGNCSFKRQKLGSLLHFDEAHQFSETDFELCYQIIKAGHRLVLIDDLVVQHRITLNLRDLAQRAYFQGKSFGQISRLPALYKERTWTSQLNREQNILVQGYVPVSALKKFFMIYDSFFHFGFNYATKSNKALKPQPSFKWRTYLRFLIKKVLRNSFEKMRSSIFLLLDRALFVARS